MNAIGLFFVGLKFHWVRLFFYFYFCLFQHLIRWKKRPPRTLPCGKEVNPANLHGTFPSPPFPADPAGTLNAPQWPRISLALPLISTPAGRISCFRTTRMKRLSAVLTMAWTVGLNSGSTRVTSWHRIRGRCRKAKRITSAFAIIWRNLRLTSSECFA